MLAFILQEVLERSQRTRIQDQPLQSLRCKQDGRKIATYDHMACGQFEIKPCQPKSKQQFPCLAQRKICQQQDWRD
jgi:hypothetical protein